MQSNPFTLYIVCSSTVTVVIDGYTHNSTLTSGDSVPLGTQIILVCRVVGLPYGTPLNYTWTCSNGDCLPKVADGSDPYNYGRKIYNDSILAVNTTYTYYGGTYTCQMTVRGQKANGSFNINITGMHVLRMLVRAHAHVSNHVKYTDRRCPDQFSLQYSTINMTCAYILGERFI